MADTKETKKTPTKKASVKKAASKKSASSKTVAKKSTVKKSASSKTQETRPSVPKVVRIRPLSKKVDLRRKKLSVKLKSEGLKVPETFTYGTGRRKSSIAKVWLFPGSGLVKVNNLDIKAYFTRDVLVTQALSPLSKLDLIAKYDVKITVLGGGLSGQSDAVKMGLARAILAMSEDYRKSLREGSFLTRDMREKERKKYGKRGARKAPQYRKR